MHILGKMLPLYHLKHKEAADLNSIYLTNQFGIPNIGLFECVPSEYSVYCMQLPWSTDEPWSEETWTPGSWGSSHGFDLSLEYQAL